MGQKVHPIGIRLGVIKDWTSTWYASGADYAKYLSDSIKIRRYLNEKLKKAAVSRIQIERTGRNAKVTVYTARPGVIIGKKGSDVDDLRKEVQKIIGEAMIKLYKENDTEIKKGKSVPNVEQIYFTSFIMQ